MESSARQLLADVDLVPHGPVRWGQPVASLSAGVYVVETPVPLDEAPIDIDAVQKWLERVPALRLDGGRPTPDELAARLSRFWIPGEQVVYVGRTTGDLGQRIDAYYRTPLGDPRPHAGGHWIRTLRGLSTFLVWWPETDEADRYEDELLKAFARRVTASARSTLPGGIVLPFANRQTASGIRKPHGIENATNRPLPRSAQVPPREPLVAYPQESSGRSGRSASLREINEALQRIACAGPEGEVTAVDAAAELDRMGVLKDSAYRGGKPLRDLLQLGAIEHAYRAAGRWYIRCARRS